MATETETSSTYETAASALLLAVMLVVLLVASAAGEVHHLVGPLRQGTVGYSTVAAAVQAAAGAMADSMLEQERQV